MECSDGGARAWGHDPGEHALSERIAQTLQFGVRPGGWLSKESSVILMKGGCCRVFIDRVPSCKLCTARKHISIFEVGWKKSCPSH